MAKVTSFACIDLKTIILLWVTICVASKDNVVGRRSISREEYLEAEELVKFLNRPKVKSIQVENGDIFDCVIITKQLAFEHPSLKNHTIQMKPTIVPKGIKNGASSHIGLKGGGCPIESVPVRRVQIQDVLRSTSISTFGRKVDLSKHRWAVAQSHGQFYGTQSFMNVWNPKIENSQQFSQSQFWVANYPETIEAGWCVSTAIFGDSKTRLFTYWTHDGYVGSGCFNLLCPGFVQVSSKIPLGSAISPTSSYGGSQYEMAISTFKDPATGNWFLRVDDEIVGYWPKSLYKHLADGAAKRADWGGEVYSEDLKSSSFPEMGSGYFPDEGYGKACFNWKIQVLANIGGPYVDFGRVTPYEKTPQCYKIVEGTKRDWGRYISFGGPGHC